jgi:hypothetical protein
MDRLERIRSDGTNAALIAFKQGFKKYQAGIWTALPAVVQSFNAAKGTVVAQPTIQAQTLQPNGTWLDTTLPVCPDCPVLFPGGGGGFTLTFPVKAGDEGLLLFASRCIDSWWQSGGVQKQAEVRMHDLSDGFFFPTGGMSNPNVPPNTSTTTAQLRNKSGTIYVEIDDANGRINLKTAATELQMDNATGRCNITAAGGLWVNGIEVTLP